MEREALVFVIGLAMLLVLPLLLALCAARCWCQHQLRASGRRRVLEISGTFVEALPNTSDGEEENVPQPRTCASNERDTRPRLAMRQLSTERSGVSEESRERMCLRSFCGASLSSSRTGSKVCFRKADWRSRQRKPVVLELPLENVRTVPVKSAWATSPCPLPRQWGHRPPSPSPARSIPMHPRIQPTS